MREHGPEATKRLSRNSGAELSDVALKVCSDKIAPQRQAHRVIGGEVAAREAAADPEPVLIEAIFDHLEHVQWAHFDVGDPSSERLA